MSDNNNLPAGEIQFHDNYIPGLEAGTYTIRMSQTVAVSGASVPDKTQQFVVQAPQFSLDPAQVHAVFPPAYSTGQFAENLPFIVLNERALPWERALQGQAASVPWLALLAFTATELQGAPTPAGNYVQTTTVGNLLTPSDANVSKRMIVPTIDPASVDTSLGCQYIEITGDAFLAIAPTLAELPYLAHCRQVNTGNSTLLGAKDKGWFSVALSNRFPSPPAPEDSAGLLNIVHLVSLEGYESYLTTSPASLPKMEAPNDTSKTKNVRLVSLANWSFTCLADAGQTFAGLVQGLFVNEQGQPENTDYLRLKLPVGPPANPNDGSATTVAQSRLNAGYVALSYHTLSGEDTYAWYKGPLTPYPTLYAPKTYPFLSASGAMIYDEQHGLFDHSLAAAWQIGRALALASQSFTKALTKFRRSGRILINRWLALGGMQQISGSEQLTAQLERNPVAEQASLWLSPQTLSAIGSLSKSTVTNEQIQAAKARLQQSRSRVQEPDTIEMTRSLMARDDVQQTLAQELADHLKPIATWLVKLGLLNHVPFDHLVPDPRLLPHETIRFFYLDQNWLDALTDGALSIGIQTGFDTLYMQAMYAAIRQAVNEALSTYISHIHAGTDIAPGTADAPEPRAGLLIRSALISGWPGLIVKSYQANTQLKTLRMERLAPDVLLCIFLGVPDKVTLSLPQESLSFGTTPDGTIDLRYVTGSNTGQPYSPLVTLDIRDNYLRAGGNRVLDVQSLASALPSRLGVPSPLTPSQFAIQFISGAEYQEIDALNS